MLSEERNVKKYEVLFKIMIIIIRVVPILYFFV